MSFWIRVFITAIGLTWGCQNQSSRAYLPDDELVKILVDMHIANAAVSRATSHLQDSLRVAYKEDIARKYKIPVEEITANLENLRKDFAHMDQVYQRVMDTLTKKMELYNDY